MKWAVVYSKTNLTQLFIFDLQIQQCVSIACGDVERAAGLVLHRRESGQARAAPPLPPPPPRPHHTLNDTELKSRIINRSVLIVYVSLV